MVSFVRNSVSLGVEFYAANTKTERHKYLKFFTACLVKYYLPRCHLFKITFQSYTFLGERWHFDYGKEQIMLAPLKATSMKGKAAAVEDELTLIFSPTQSCWK